VNSSPLSTVFAGLTAMAIAGCGGGGHAPVAPARAEAAPVEVASLINRVETFEPSVAAAARMQSAARAGAATWSKRERPLPSLVRLPPVSRPPADARGNSGGFGAPVQIGVAREVTTTSDSAAMGRALQWQHGASRTAAAVSFTSPGAAGLRLGLLVRKLPADALVRGYVQGADIAFEIPGRVILDAIGRNRDAGDLSDGGRTYWTPMVESEELTLEIALPPGTPADTVEVSVPRLSHLYVKAGDLNTAKIGQADSCEIDVSCVSEAEPLSRATARMIFTDSGASFLCTGTLMNDSSSSGTPYFLGANHCISTQTAASSLATYWFYRSTSCNSGILNGGFRALYLGATLLYASAATDTSFMRLNEPAPAGVAYAAWDAGVPGIGSDIVGIHHPMGDLQKYSQGSISAYGNCGSVTASDTFSCTSANSSTGSFLNSGWKVGTTEPGSSGSGLFAAIGGARYLVGQLFGGSASCSLPTGTNWYGRFDIAYAAALSRWLSPSGAGEAVTPRSAVYRFYNATMGDHFFTQSTAERDGIIAGNTPFSFEGVGFYAYGSQVAGSSPVYRFYNTRTGEHFYTISAAERDYVIATYPEFSYEGTSWYAQAASGGTAAPVFRFYNAETAAHFYTISAAEKDWVVQRYPSFRPEGVGYYAWTTQ
jgi:lysyl endopeptidase